MRSFFGGLLTIGVSHLRRSAFTDSSNMIIALRIFLAILVFGLSSTC
jgi:hypothetical protein